LLPTCLSLAHGILRNGSLNDSRPVCLPLWLEPVHRCALLYDLTRFYPLSIVLGYTVATDRWLKVCPVFSKRTVLLCLLSSMSSLQSP
jgi:hypothetical protein